MVLERDQEDVIAMFGQGRLVQPSRMKVGLQAVPETIRSRLPVGWPCSCQRWSWPMIALPKQLAATLADAVPFVNLVERIVSGGRTEADRAGLDVLTEKRGVSEILSMCCRKPYLLTDEREPSRMHRAIVGRHQYYLAILDHPHFLYPTLSAKVFGPDGLTH
jgi:hypothetical protein